MQHLNQPTQHNREVVSSNLSVLVLAFYLCCYCNLSKHIPIPSLKTPFQLVDQFLVKNAFCINLSALTPFQLESQVASCTWTTGSAGFKRVSRVTWRRVHRCTSASAMHVGSYLGTWISLAGLECLLVATFELVTRPFWKGGGQYWPAWRQTRERCTVGFRPKVVGRDQQ